MTAFSIFDPVSSSALVKRVWSMLAETSSGDIVPAEFNLNVMISDCYTYD